MLLTSLYILCCSTNDALPNSPVLPRKLRTAPSGSIKELFFAPYLEEVPIICDEISVYLLLFITSLQLTLLLYYSVRVFLLTLLIYQIKPMCRMSYLKT